MESPEIPIQVTDKPKKNQHTLPIPEGEAPTVHPTIHPDDYTRIPTVILPTHPAYAVEQQQSFEPQQTIEPQFLLPEVTTRQKVFKLFGGDFDFLDPDKKKVLFAHQESLAEAKSEHKFLTRIHIYPSSKETDPKQALLHITTKKKFDLVATYDVADKNGVTIGHLKRRPIRSTLWADKWDITNAKQENIGEIKEVGVALKMVVDLLLDILHLPLPFIRRKFEICNLEGKKVATITKGRNPFVEKITRKVHAWDHHIDPRLITAAHVSLSALTI